MRRTCAAVLVLGLILGCASEARVEDELADANYCDSPDDCIDIHPGCPFGCYALINRAEQTRIEKLLDRYRRRHGETCAHDCVGYDGLDCIEDQCVVYSNLDAHPRP